jgi:hypothetical protein
LRSQSLIKDPSSLRGPAPQPLSSRRSSPKPRQPEEIEDILQDLPDRQDLQRLYDRKVPLDQIVRLLGHRVERDRIGKILDCDDPAREIRRLLG